jgi:membrane fusion protein (multidrug efflux system)
MLALLPALLAACGGGEQKPAQPAANAGGPPPVEVLIDTVTRGEVTLTPELPGRVAAVRSAQVRARVEGIVGKRLFTEGSDVRAGQQLFQLDDRTFRTSAQAAEADVELKRISLQRIESLLPRKAVSQQEADTARAALKQAEAQLARARLDLENTTVPAPISGRIGRTLVTEGALVGRGDATLMATIEQLDPVHVLFTQPNADVLRLRGELASGRLKAANSRQVSLMLETGQPYGQPGRLIFNDMSVDPSTGAVTLKAEFPNPDRLLLPGTYVRVKISQAMAPQAVSVPQRAVLSGGQGQYVLLVGKEQTVKVRPVKLGPMAGDRFVIDQGLSGGETVIVSGAQKVRPGMRVKPVAAKQPN